MSILVISNRTDFRMLYNCFRIFYFKILIFQHWKRPAQGTNTVPIVSAHFRSLHSSASPRRKRHLDRFSRFSTTHARDQQTHTHTHTHTHTWSAWYSKIAQNRGITAEQVYTHFDIAAPSAPRVLMSSLSVLVDQWRHQSLRSRYIFPQSPPLRRYRLANYAERNPDFAVGCLVCVTRR